MKNDKKVDLGFAPEFQTGQEFANIEKEEVKNKFKMFIGKIKCLFTK